MKREIRFRAWDGERMLQNVGFHPNIIQKHDGYKDGDAGQYTISPSFDSYTLMQFTGLLDKNGVEIYEGDVIRHLIYPFNGDQTYEPTYNKIQEVTFYRGCFGLNNNIASFDCMNHTYEVIGNIHQHPELLTPITL